MQQDLSTKTHTQSDFSKKEKNLFLLNLSRKILASTANVLVALLLFAKRKLDEKLATPNYAELLDQCIPTHQNMDVILRRKF